MLTEILPPGPEHAAAVSAVLEAVVLEHGMSDQDVATRQNVVLMMQDLLVSVLPGMSPGGQHVGVVHKWFARVNNIAPSLVCRGPAQALWIVLHQVWI